jgi:Zn-dependent protease/predicted transcriptional regulator
MNRGIRIVKLFGIKIRIDWSWLLILLLVVWNLSSAFSQVHPDWDLSFSILMGVIAALLFFLSVLLHELAHSLVAKSQGIAVTNITLFLFGGVSNIREEPKSPSNEFWMAILGPVTSLVIGFSLLLVSGIGINPQNLMGRQPMEVLGELSAIRTLTFWLGSINVLLGIFNLIPGYPLDGGRVLRSIFWAITKNLRKATRWASYVGQVIAWTMIVSGIAMVFGIRIPFFGEGLVNGLWLIFIGWFLNNAARSGYHQLVIRDVLEDVPVRQMSKRNPPTVPANISVDSLVEDYIMQMDDQAFPVMEAEKLVGIVTLDDVRRIPGIERGTTTVAEIMTPRDDMITVSPDDDAHEALRSISTNAIRQLVVLENDQLFGLVRRRDIVRFLQLQSDEINTPPREQKLGR